MGWVKKISALVGLLAVTIGVISQTKPELFLKVPNGFILWAMTGNPMPPYITTEPWGDEFGSWAKEGDLVVAVGPKSGTTWMLYCTHQIRTKAEDSFPPYTDTMFSTPWPELLQRPGQTWADMKDLMNTTVLPDGTPYRHYWDNENFPFRIFKSHATPDILKVRQYPKMKFLSVARNGLDVVNSLVPFFNSHEDDFRGLWGGFPPKSSGLWETDASQRLKDLLPGGMLEGFYFGYINKWWPARNEPNVLMLHYADLKKDLAGNVAKIAEFMGVDLTPFELERVTGRCSYKHMKKHQEEFLYRLPLNPDFDGSVMKPGSMTRKGLVGEGKHTFSEEDQALWAKAEEEMIPDKELLRWAREGGTFH